MPVLDAQHLINDRVDAIRQYHHDTGQKRAELDVSGGVDSAVVLGLLVKALGPEKITAVYQGINSNPGALVRARSVAMAFGVPLIEIDLTEAFNWLVENSHSALYRAGYNGREVLDRCFKDPTILGSLRSCLRAPVGRFFNRLTGGGIRHGTGNECEDRWLRFYQKGGDGEVDTNPIAMLSKGEVYQLAVTMGVPQPIITARPSPDLWGSGDKHNDEDELTAYMGVELPDTRTQFNTRRFNWYSYVDAVDAHYENVGVIERISRFLDELMVSVRTNGDFLFSDKLTNAGLLRVVEQASEHPTFKGMSVNLITALLTAAARIERATRHKANPNIPSLGDRKQLIVKGILTNDLPERVL